MRHKHIQHGPRRRWWAPWTLICRCGMAAWPCYAVRMLDGQSRMRPRPPDDEHGSSWDGPTLQVATLGAERPLLTRGQADRSRRRSR